MFGIPKRAKPDDPSLTAVIRAADQILQGRTVLLDKQHVFHVHAYQGGCAVDTANEVLAEQVQKYYLDAGLKATTTKHRHHEQWLTVLIGTATEA